MAARSEDGFNLSARVWDVLAQAKADIDETGRMRTSSEIHGLEHRKRGHLLLYRRRLENWGLLARPGHGWDDGIVTELGLHVLATVPRPPERKHRQPMGGLHSDGGTRFKTALVNVSRANILSNGHQNHKLGHIVTQRHHKGLQLRAITLEEGATCPKDCQLRSTCYGGNMPSAKRIRWDGEKTGKAITEAIRASKPVLIRAHTLGDFPSIRYVRDFRAALIESRSAAFGYTHWSPEKTTLGYMLRLLSNRHWDYFSIRTSYKHGSRKPLSERAAVIISHPDQAKEHNAVICPEQLGKTSSCADCGYCWATRRNVAFLEHDKIARFRAPNDKPLPPIVLKEAA